MDLSTPATQKAADCPITFVMDDESAGTTDEFSLLIRPEQLTIGFPSRMTVNQSLGGGWADAFGEGLEEGTFAGTLGWRASSNDSGGIERLANMKRFVYSDWHAKRAAAVAKGDDPSKVKLILVDTLNNYTRVIAPRLFELQRSKNSPLMARYRFNFVMISKDATGSDLLGGDFGDLFGGGLLGSIASTVGSWVDSFTTSINNITVRIREAYKWVDKTIITPVRAVVGKTMQIYRAVNDMVTAGVGITRQVGSIATLATQAVSNVFKSAALVLGIPNIAKAAIMGVVREFSNIFCLLQNARKLLTYEDYSDIYGASNCSSTNGGRSISVYSGSTNNTFSAVSATSRNVVQLTQSASNSLKSLASTDLVTTPLSTSVIKSSLNVANAGLSVAA